MAAVAKIVFTVDETADMDGEKHFETAARQRDEQSLTICFQKLMSFSSNKKV
jgi:hypothetical protein